MTHKSVEPCKDCWLYVEILLYFCCHMSLLFLGYQTDLSSLFAIVQNHPHRANRCSQSNSNHYRFNQSLLLLSTQTGWNLDIHLLLQDWNILCSEPKHQQLLVENNNGTIVLFGDGIPKSCFMWEISSSSEFQLQREVTGALARPNWNIHSVFVYLVELS